MAPSAEPRGHDAGTQRPASPRGEERGGCGRRLLLVLLSLLVSLLLAEGALRLTGIVGSGRGSPWFAGGNHPRFLFQADAASGYTLRPGFHGREVAPGHEFDVPVAIDADGLRDHTHVASARPVVLALGDSMTFGEGVAAEGSWSAVLERALGARVYDGGVPGYSSRQMLGRMRALAPRLHPDLVIVALSPRWDRQRIEEPFVYDEGFIVATGYAPKLRLIDGNLYLADVRWPVVGTATAEAKRWSHVARLLLPALRRAAGSLSGERHHAGAQEALRPQPSAEALATMQQLARAQGARLLVLFLDSRGPEYERDRDDLAAVLRAHGIPFVAADALVPAARWPALRYPRDKHWNAAGQRAVGEALAPIVRPLLAADHRDAVTRR